MSMAGWVGEKAGEKAPTGRPADGADEGGFHSVAGAPAELTVARDGWWVATLVNILETRVSDVREPITVPEKGVGSG